MVTREEDFYYHFNLEERKFLVEKYGTDIKEDLKKIMRADLMSTRQQNPIANIDDKIKAANLRIKEATARIKESEATHWETFGTKPSPEAKQAIAVGAKNSFEPYRTQPAYQNYSKPITQKDFDASQHCTTFQDQLKGYHAKCNYCEFVTSHSRDDAQQAIADIKTHLPQRHYSEVWK